MLLRMLYWRARGHKRKIFFTKTVILFMSWADRAFSIYIGKRKVRLKACIKGVYRVLR